MGGVLRGKKKFTDVTMLKGITQHCHFSNGHIKSQTLTYYLAAACETIKLMGLMDYTWCGGLFSKYQANRKMRMEGFVQRSPILGKPNRQAFNDGKGHSLVLKWGYLFLRSDNSTNFN